jgi:ribosomal-protein-alanine N-acetyltransferase
MISADSPNPKRFGRRGRRAKSGDGVAAPLVLEGERLLLRPLADSDVGALLDVRLENREFLAPFEPRRPDSFFTPEGQAEDIARATRDWAVGRQYAFGIFLRSSQELVGRIAISGVARGPFENAHLGYFVAERHGGHGLATEAVGLTLEFAFGPAGLNRVQAAVMPRNVRSRRVLEKSGFTLEALARRYLCIDGVWEDHEIFGITRLPSIRRR